VNWELATADTYATQCSGAFCAQFNCCSVKFLTTFPEVWAALNSTTALDLIATGCVICSWTRVSVLTILVITVGINFFITVVSVFTALLCYALINI